ncbi:hypothetical protein [Aquimarina pacifica]|nr:hypothetical protein [Aquimarina pacifica]
MKKNRKVDTTKKLNLEKFQISKIKNPKVIMGGKKDDDATTIFWPN